MNALVKVIDGKSTFRYPMSRVLQRAGRDPSCEIYLQGDEVSRRHTEITTTHEGIFVRDLDSANGTFVNDRRITDLTMLHIGDRLMIGTHLFVLVKENSDFLDATITDGGEHARDLRLPAASLHADLPTDIDTTTISTKPEELLAEAGDLDTEERESPRLVVIQGPKRGCVMALIQPEITIGRSPECNLVLPDSQVSACHAKVMLRKGGHYLYDERSLNGVYVNDFRVRGVPLKSGDHVRLGDTELVFDDPANPTPIERMQPRSPAATAPGKSPPWAWIAGGALALTIVVAVVLYFL